MQNMEATVHDPKADAAVLHKAFKGAGTDEDAVISVLAHRTKHELELIDHEYRTQSSSGTTLQHALEKELSGSFRDLAVSVVTPVLELKKRCLKQATKGAGTRESTLIDVLCQSTNEEIAEIAKDADIYKNVMDDVSGDFKKVLVHMFRAERPYGPIPIEKAAELEHTFYKAGEGKIGTDENKYIDVITRNSLQALHQVDEIYKSKHKHGLIKAVESETSGDFKSSLIALLKPHDEYFADRLYHAIAGLGTDERVLIYVFSVSTKDDVHRIAQIYQEKRKESLESAIKGDTSFNFKKFLIQLLH